MEEARIIINNRHNNIRLCIASINKSALDTIKSERIFFDSLKLRIRLPSYDDNKTSKISFGKTSRKKYKTKNYEYKSDWGSFGFINISNEDISGKYELEKDGDYFILHKVRDEIK